MPNKPVQSLPQQVGTGSDDEYWCIHPCYIAVVLSFLFKTNKQTNKQYFDLLTPSLEYVIFRTNNVISIHHSIRTCTLTLCWKEQMNNTTKTWISEWILYDQNSSFSFYVRSCKLCMFYKWQNISPKTCIFIRKVIDHFSLLSYISQQIYIVFSLVLSYRFTQDFSSSILGVFSTLRSWRGLLSPRTLLPTLSSVHLSPETLFLCLQRLTWHALLWRPCLPPFCSRLTVEEGQPAGPTLHNSAVSITLLFPKQGPSTFKILSYTVKNR